MKVVADCGNLYYYKQRAIEMITTTFTNSSDPEVKTSLRQAIGLLALALAEMENGQAKIKNPR